MSSEHSRVRVLSALGCVSAVLLSACAPDLGPAPSLAPPEAFKSAETLSDSGGHWPQDAWWTVYGDPQLNALEEEALSGSPDLKIAAARIRAAAAQVETARAAGRPQASASTQIDEARIGQSIGLPSQISSYLPSGFGLLTQTSANVSYALDFFGRNRQALAQATSLAEARQADLAEARRQLTYAVALAYGQFVLYSAQRQEAVEAVRVREDTLKLVGDRRRNGLETRGEFSQQNATVAQAQTQVDALDLQLAQARDAIAALLGAGPDRGRALQVPALAGDSLALEPLALPPNVPANLMARRPDLTAARLRAEAAAHRIKAARADFYPNVNLAGSALDLSLNNASPFKNFIDLEEVGPAISLPIFSGGRLEGALRGARADYDEAVSTYNKAFAQALSEVADALGATRLTAVELADARAALAASEDAYSIAKLRYQGGLAPYLAVLTAESAVLQQRQTVVTLTVEALLANVALVRALGGGYVDAPPPHASVQTAR